MGGFTRGRTKSENCGGELSTYSYIKKLGEGRGAVERVHALLCSITLLTFVSKYSDFLRMTQHIIYSRVHVHVSIEQKRVCVWAGRGAIAAKGVAFHMQSAAPSPPQGYV